jgi:hypothetical protein
MKVPRTIAFAEKLKTKAENGKAHRNQGMIPGVLQSKFC